MFSFFVRSTRITICPGLAAVIASVILAWGFAQAAIAEPYGFGDIRLGSTFDALSRQLDFRDINAALGAQHEANKPVPDLGRRGYGCMRGANAYADVVCVSHQEKVGGEPTREIRLQFLEGTLQKFSITVEVGKSAALLDALRAQHGQPSDTTAAGEGGFASQRWRKADSVISAYSGKDLVFVSFELAGYRKAVGRRQRGEAAPAPP